MLNKSGEWAPLSCSWSERECFQLFAVENDVNCGFVLYIYSLYVEICSLYAHFLESFNHKWILNVTRGFYCSYWDDCIAFILQFVNVVYHIAGLADMEKSLHPWDKSWSWCMILLMYCGFGLLVFCWGFLHLCSSLILAYYFLFLSYLCLVLVSV